MEQGYWAVLLAGGVAMKVFGFFRRSRRDEVPEWAQFFSGSEFEAFMSKVQTFWSGRGLTARIEGAKLQVGEQRLARRDGADQRGAEVPHGAARGVG